MKKLSICSIFTVFLMLDSFINIGFANTLDKMMGPNACAECHEKEAAIWKNTHHATSFKNMPTSDKAEAIKKAMGIKRIKTSEICATCHFTQIKKSNGKIRTIAGTSCESCHGASREWIDIHADYGGKQATKQTESKAHKQQRLAKSQANGMIIPGNYYEHYRQCFKCHTIPQEDLINKSKHPLGDKFELVAWSNGEIRHNVWSSSHNRLESIEVSRLKFVLGQLLDLEFSLQGYIKGSKEDKFTKAMMARVIKILQKLNEIQNKVNISEVDNVLQDFKIDEVKLENKEAISKMIENIQLQAKAFAKNHNGKKLQAIDKLLPTKFKGDPKG